LEELWHAHGVLAIIFEAGFVAGTVTGTMPDETGQDDVPEIAVRIPGTWSCPASLEKSLPKGFELSAGWLQLPGGDRLRVFVHPPDDDFADIFTAACRGAVPDAESSRIRGYGVNLCLAGSGGSIEAAQRMMKGVAAVIRAGGMGVFIDNSGAGHLGCDWLDLAGDPDDAATFPAFVASYANGDNIYSVGMHVLGLRDAIMPRTGDREADACVLSSFLLYTIFCGVADGDFIGDDKEPTHRVWGEDCDFPPPGTPMHNPYGCWRLEVFDG